MALWKHEDPRSRATTHWHFGQMLWSPILRQIKPLPWFWNADTPPSQPMYDLMTCAGLHASSLPTLPFIFFPPPSISRTSPCLFLPFLASKAVALARCQELKGLFLFPSVRPDEQTSSTGSEEVVAKIAFRAAARVARPEVGGVVGTMDEGLTGVMRTSSSVSCVNSVMSLSVGGISSISVVASSSSTIFFSCREAVVGQSRRGFTEERVKWCGGESSWSSSVPFPRGGPGLQSGSFGNRRYIFLPRLNLKHTQMR